MIHPSRPPKEVDLPTILFTKPGYQPKYGRTSDQEQLRRNYGKHELTARLQHNGLFLASALLRSTEHIEDIDAKKFARTTAAIMLLTASWHSYAEVRPNSDEHSFRAVRRRRLLLPDYLHLAPEERPDQATMHTEAGERVTGCIIASKGVINAARQRNKEKLADANHTTGKLLGTSAVFIASADAAGNLLGGHEAQAGFMQQSQALIYKAKQLEQDIGFPPALAAAADPAGSRLQEYIKDTMPRAVTDEYYAVEKALFAC